MVPQQLETWAAAKGYRYVFGANEEQHAIAVPIGQYMFSFTYEYDANHGAGTSALGWYFGGIIGGMLTSSASQTYLIKLAVDSATWEKPLLKELKKALKGIGTPFYAKGYLSISMKKPAHKEETYERMIQAVEITAPILSAANVAMPQECAMCHTSGCDDLAVCGKPAMLRPVHAGCAAMQKQNILDKIESSQQKEGVFLPLIVALVGFVLGIIAAFILAAIGLDEYLIFPAFACAMPPLCAFGLYGRFHGAAKAPVLILFTLLTIVSIPIVAFGSNFFYNYAREGVSLLRYIRYLRADSAFFWDIVISNLVVGAIGGFLGLIGSWSSLKGNRKQRAVLREKLGQKTGQSQAKEAPPVEF